MVAGGRWQALPGVRPEAGFLTSPDGCGLYREDNHMWLFAWENDEVFHGGPSRTMNFISLQGQVSTRAADLRGSDVNAMNGNAIMYDIGKIDDIGKILTVGGSPNYENDRGTANAHVSELSGGNASARQVANLERSRALSNSVALPSGEVVVIGGQQYSQLFTDDEAVLVPELFDPVSETWSDLPVMQTPRTYHSMALLLPDCRVLAGGGGLCGDCATNHPDIEILTPPYLLDAEGNPAARPELIQDPTSARDGEQVVVSASGAARFSLARLANATHSVNTEQRRVPLQSASSGGDDFVVTMPATDGIAPPGFYMLFALDANGTPSTARFIRLGS